MKTLNNMSEYLTLDQFREQYHWIEEECWVRGVINTNSKVNVNNDKIGSSCKINKHLNVNKSVNGFKRTTPRIPMMTSMSCFPCGKKGHYFWECKFLKYKKDEDGNANEAIVIKDIIAMVSDVCNYMINVLHMVVIINPSNWWFDSDTI